MRRHGFLLTACLALLSARGTGAEEARVTLLHTADLHGALTAHDYPTGRPAPRGLVRLASLIETARRDTVPSLLLDAGDAFQGGIEAAWRSGVPGSLADARAAREAPGPTLEAMNRLRYDAMAIGNHELDGGLAHLERLRAAARFPMLAANVVGAAGGPAFRGSMVAAAGPLRVGVIGVTTPAVPFLLDSARWAGLRFGDPVEAARAEARRLRETERCDAVVVLAHTGLETEEEAAAADPENWGRRLAAAGIADVLILGHSHRVVTSLEIGGTLVTQAGKWGEHLGRVDLAFARAAPGERWRRTARRARVLAVSDTTRADSALAAFAEPYHRAAESALSEVLGEAAADLDAPAGRFADGPAWDLIHRVQLEATGAEVSLASLDAADPAIRRGPITLRDVLRLVPYENSLVAVELTGAELRQALEHGARSLAPYTFAAGAPLENPLVPGHLFDSAEGVSYAIDLTRPPGERIVDLRLGGEPLDPARRLTVAINGYRRAGAGGYEVLRRAPRVGGVRGEVRDLVAGHVRRTRRIEPAASSNWTLLPDYATRPERPLVDRLVRREALRPEEVLRLEPRRPARRADLARWMARAFGWEERRPSGAFADLPDSLAAGFDALLRRGVLGELPRNERIRPEHPIRLPAALDWCERAARHANYALAPRRDPSFRAGLLAGVGEPGRAPDTLTRIQALGLVANLRYPSLRVLETTDFHGAIHSRARDRTTGRPVGGSAVLAAWIERLRSANPEGTVLLDGGDCFQGTMISNLQFGRPVVEQMNALRYTAMAVGNHEFDWSTDTLVRRVREMRFAALAANLRERVSGRLPDWVRADTVFQRRGVRIAVLGLSYRFTPSVTLARHVAHLRFEDDSLTAARRVPALRAAADVVIGVGHVPAESDSGRRASGGDLVRMARGIRGVDLWLGGHSHNQVLDRVGGVPLIVSGSHGQVVGLCDLVVDPIAHRVVESHAELVPTFADAIEPDSSMLALIERWNQAVDEVAGVPVGRSARTLVRNRGGESALGNLVADAIRAAVGADVAMQNSGGLRADLPAGPLTKSTIYEVMPFDNQIYTLELTGAEVERALEDGLRHGRVTQVSGIRYVFDWGRPAGDRVLSVTNEHGVPLQPDRSYKVAVNDFMATGGDDYQALSGGRRRTNTGILVRDVLEEYARERSRDGGAIDVQTDGRIRRAGTREGGG